KDVFGVRVGATPLRESLLLRAGTREDADNAVIPLVAPRLVQLILVIAPFRHVGSDGPGPCPGRRVFDRHLVANGPGVEPREALDETQVLTGSAIVRLASEVGGLDDQRLPFPSAVRVTQILT